MDGPDSSYSALEIHICWKVEREARIEPPIHTEYFLSGGATTLIFIVEGASAVSSLVILSAMPGNIVVPPDMTMLAYRSLRMSMSHFMMVWKVQSWMPDASLPMREGWNRTSGHLNLSLPITITLPSVVCAESGDKNEFGTTLFFLRTSIAGYDRYYTNTHMHTQTGSGIYTQIEKFSDS